MADSSRIAMSKSTVVVMGVLGTAAIAGTVLDSDVRFWPVLVVWLAGTIVGGLAGARFNDGLIGLAWGGPIAVFLLAGYRMSALPRFFDGNWPPP